jgi:hypothetical protein
VKPWEDDWTEHAGFYVYGRRARFFALEGTLEDVVLAAAAPRLYRALKAVEWCGVPDDETVTRRPCTYRRCSALEGDEHDPDCIVGEALRLAEGGT